MLQRIGDEFGSQKDARVAYRPRPHALTCSRKLARAQLRPVGSSGRIRALRYDGLGAGLSSVPTRISRDVAKDSLASAKILP